MNPKIQAVIDAWNVPGPVPDYHYGMQNKIRREWPVLGKALDALSRSEME